ncbi:hypothetical protein [Bacillus weihaiensis]|uniref:Uncharacterized protein n=1 Tax=Bacillus weihaiensis TaxID=1547283 RepID=A0A1L3MRL5_9BACI|nr:hypothetical protein [Bacillus weihaiensis]APH04957.1 hypothetical protein A9C19_09450 [Bacillus weihaiensis]
MKINTFLIQAGLNFFFLFGLLSGFVYYRSGSILLPHSIAAVVGGFLALIAYMWRKKGKRTSENLIFSIRRDQFQLI